MATSPPEETVALVTGANQAIGLAVANLLAKDHGYHVIVGSRNPEDGVHVAAAIRDSGYKATSVQLDITSDESIHAAAKTIERNFGRLDVLVNNAAISLDTRMRGKGTRELFSQTLDKTTGWYSIDYKAYDSSKAAVNMLALNYARTLDEVGGLVNIVCPGYVKSNLTNFDPISLTPEQGARHIIKMATLDRNGPTRTFPNFDGQFPW